MKKAHDFDFTFDCQGVFRKLLDAISNPGRIVSIEEYSGRINDAHRTCLALAATLIDNEIRFHVIGDEQLAEAINQFTFGQRNQLENSDFIFVVENCSMSEIDQILSTVSCGTLESPHQSATLLVQIDQFGAETRRLSGPGIDGVSDLPLSLGACQWLNARKQQNMEYPCGVDLVFMTDKGDLMAAPRLVHPVSNI